MVKYVAFLRAINVGGSKVIKMEILRQIFESLGFANVRTYIQSGNVIFDARQKNVSSLTTKIEKELERSTGHKVEVMLTTFAELQSMVKLDPFKRVEAGPDVMLFVTFLSSEPSLMPKLPINYDKENLQVLALRDRAAFIVAKRKQNGMFGFPNNFLEKQFGSVGTTRNWTTVKKIVDFVER